MIRSVENAGLPPAAPARGAPRLLVRAGRHEPSPAAGLDATAPEEAGAWAEVLAGWGDEARHRAYLERFRDLEGLAVAGRRYREALLARPGDAVAARQRDEVLRRALALGFASLPRTRPGAGRVQAAVLALLGGLAVAAVLLVLAAGVHLGAVP
jgi:hypothetical protein